MESPHPERSPESHSPEKSHSPENPNLKRRLPAREKGAHILLVAASFVLVIAGMRAISSLALPLLIAIFLSILSTPLLNWLTRHRIPRVIAVAMTVLSNILVVVALLLLLGGSLNTFLQSLPKYQERIEIKTGTTLAWLAEHGIDTSELGWLENLSEEEIEGPIPSTEKEVSSIEFGSFVGFFTTALRSVASVISMGFIVFLLMVFILLEADDMPRKLELAFGWKDEAMENFTRDIQRYLGIKTLVSLTTGILIGVWLLTLGMENAVLWGMIAFLLNYIPSIGSIIASIPAILLGWIDHGPAYALLVALGYLLVNISIGNFIEPHLMGRRFGLSTLVVILSLLFWGWVWGPVGMLLSVPLTMMFKILMENTADFRWLARLLGSNRRRPAEPKRT